MDDIGEKISALLNSSDGMEKLKSVAESVLGGIDTVSHPESNKSNEDFSIPENLLSNLGNMQSIMRIASVLGKEQSDSRIDLLRALKPHLSEERQKKCDNAIKMLKMVKLLPLIKDSGLFDMF